jgi:murein L,D-transpeptidase YafK
MSRTTAVLIIGMVLLSFVDQNDFLEEQKKYERVRTAIGEKQKLVESNLGENGIALNNVNLLMVAYKDADQLDVYAKTNNETKYRKVSSYKVCARSGQLGPKRKEGDNQVPEGFYHIDRFNPLSKFYLSLGLNYPNTSDRKKSTHPNLGGDIFIHGSCVTIGCLPMTDSGIKEIYLMAIHARNNGQLKIPVYVFPFKMTDQNLIKYRAKYKENRKLIAFWDNLKVGYDAFMKDKKELSIKVNEYGDYYY